MYRVKVTRDEDFLFAECLEHSNCFTQGKDLREVLDNMKEVFALILNEHKPKIELILEDETVDMLLAANSV